MGDLGAELRERGGREAVLPLQAGEDAGQVGGGVGEGAVEVEEDGLSQSGWCASGR